MTSAINIGLKYVNADYFFKLDSDDYLSKSSLKMISNSIKRVKESKIKGKYKCLFFSLMQAFWRINK